MKKIEKKSIALVKKPKVFIMGLSGFIGYNLALQLREKFSVCGVYFKHMVHIPDVHAFPLSLNNLEALESLIAILSPDFTIMAAGIVDPKFCEENPKVAESINVILPLSLAVNAQKKKSKFIHLSCAEVFDGNLGNYKEDDRSNFTTEIYGKFKVSAETFIKAQTMESTIVRMGKVIGIGNPYRPNYFEKIRISVDNKKTIFADEALIQSYHSVQSIGENIEKILTHPFPSARHRNLHIGGVDLPEIEMLTTLCKFLGGDPESLIKGYNKGRTRKTNLTIQSAATEKAIESEKESLELLMANFKKSLRPGLPVPAHKTADTLTNSVKR